MRVAVVGASTNREKYGNKAVRSYVAGGHEVIPINPNEPEVEGLKTCAKVTEVTGQLDRVLMYVPPDVGITLLEDIAAKEPGEVYLNPGAESPELVEKARELGLSTVLACAIVDIGDSPARYR